jgi:hypothetical protein
VTAAKWTINTGEQQDLRNPAARFNEKGCLLVWVGDVLTFLFCIFQLHTVIPDWTFKLYVHLSTFLS